MLKLDKVNINYGRKRILSDVSFTAESGQLIGLLGLNGSGKSTLLTIIAGLRRPHSGSVKLDDTDITSPSYRKNFGYVTQETALIPELSALDNLRLWTPMKKDEIISLLSNPPLSILKVQDFIDVPVRSMSGGMKKRLQLATVLIGNPEVLLLDEPLSALDIPAKEDIINYILEFRKSGGLIIAASHDDELFYVSDRILFIDSCHVSPVAPGTDYHGLLRGRIHE